MDRFSQKRCKRSRTSTFDALPEEVADRILCKLPALDLVENLPQVCSEWRSKLRSPLFQRLYNHSSVATGSKWLLTEPDYGNLCILDTKAKRYKMVNKAKLLASAGVPSPETWDFCTAASGLLLFGAKRVRPKERKFVLLNPHNRTKHMLEPLPAGLETRFTVNSHTQPSRAVLLLESQQLLLLEYLPRNRVVAVMYDFRTGLWTVKQPCSARIPEMLKGDLDAENLVVYGLSPDKLHLARYDIRSDQWSVVTLECPPKYEPYVVDRTIPGLVVCQGEPLILSLLMIPPGEFMLHDLTKTQLAVWRLTGCNKNNKRRLQLESVAPLKLMRKLYRNAGYEVSRLRHDFGFKFCGDGLQNVWALFNKSGRMLLYNRLSRLWSLHPGVPGKIKGYGNQVSCTTFSFLEDPSALNLVPC